MISKELINRAEELMGAHGLEIKTDDHCTKVLKQPTRKQLEDYDAALTTYKQKIAENEKIDYYKRSYHVAPTRPIGERIFQCCVGAFPNCCGISVAYGFTFSEGFYDIEFWPIVELAILQAVVKRKNRLVLAADITHSPKPTIPFFEAMGWDSLGEVPNPVHPGHKVRAFSKILGKDLLEEKDLDPNATWEEPAPTKPCATCKPKKVEVY